LKKNKNENISKTLKKIFKNKKISSEQKVSLMINKYAYYFENKLHSDVEMCTKEYYFEKFMIDGKYKHEYMFKKYFNAEYENAIYLHAVTLNQYFVKLENKVDVQKLTTKEQKIFQNIISFSQRCNFHDDFNYAAFYYNEGVREIILENLKIFEHDFKSLSNNNLFGF